MAARAERAVDPGGVRRLLADAWYDGALADDGMSLLFEALAVLPEREPDGDVVSSTTVLVAAVRWGTRPGTDAPQALRSMVAELAEHPGYEQLVEHFLFGEDPASKAAPGPGAVRKSGPPVRPDAARAVRLSSTVERVLGDGGDAPWTAVGMVAALVRPDGPATGSFLHDRLRNFLGEEAGPLVARMLAAAGPGRVTGGYADVRGDTVRTTLPGGRTRDLLVEDRLGIEGHVRALSLLVASRNLQPPLAIGLFGDWGTGKTYFIRALRQEVDRLTRAARSSGLEAHQLGVHQRVVQIEFNAWHYVDTDLWASLGDFIFANLAIDHDEEATSIADRRRKLVGTLRSLGAAARQAERLRLDVEDRLAAARDELEQRRSEARERRAGIDVARAAVRASDGLRQRAVEAAQQAGLAPVATGALELREELASARQELASGGQVLAALRGRYGSRTAVLGALLLVALVVAVAVLGDLVLPAVPDWTGLVAALGTAAAAARTLATATAGATARVDALLDELDAQVERDPEVRRRRSEYDEAVAAHETALEREDGLRGQLDAAQEELDALSEARMLSDFIVARRDSDDYRRHLGLASTVRRDFEKLAELIRGYNAWHGRPADQREGDEPTLEPGDHVVNRIVLYIDDLDRCPPARVIEVLQAVHLLLAFDLFVVVVGVDARWLSRSLRHHYDGLLGPSDGAAEDVDDTATPHDYLEKIFQIPVWLRPMGPGDKQRLLEALTAPRTPTDGEDGVREGAATDVQRRQAAAEQGPDEASTGSAGEGSSGEAGGPSAGEAQGAGAGSPFTASEELRAAPIEVDGDERALMELVLPLLGRSPRQLTRFVNVYRVIRAVERHAEERDDAPPPRPDVSMVLLAIVTGMPDLANTLVAVLREGEQASFGDVVAALDGGPDTARLRDWLEENAGWREREVASWVEVADDVARYSYRVDQAS